MWKLKSSENYSNLNPSEVPLPETHEYFMHSVVIKVEYILHILYFDDFVKGCEHFASHVRLPSLLILVSVVTFLVLSFNMPFNR